MPRDFPEAQPNEPPLRFHAPRAGHYHLSRAQLRIDHNIEWPHGVQVSLAEPRAFAAWLDFKGDYQPAIGKAVQTFLLADDPALAPEQRLELARLQIQIRGAADLLRPEALVRQSDAFRTFVQQQFAPAGWRPKFPVEAWLGRRLLKLEADLWVENAENIEVLLFAGFAEGMKKWKAQAQTATPPAAWLYRVLPRMFSGKTIRYWLVFALEGQVVELMCRSVAAAEEPA